MCEKKQYQPYKPSILDTTQFIEQINSESTRIEIKVVWTNENAKTLLWKKVKSFSKLRLLKSKFRKTCN